MLLLAAGDGAVGSVCDSSSMMTLLSAADGMVGRKRTLSLGDDEQLGSDTSSCTACWRTRRGLALHTDGLPVDYNHDQLITGQCVDAANSFGEA